MLKKKDWNWVDWTKVGSIFVVAGCIGLAALVVLDIVQPRVKFMKAKARQSQQRVLGETSR